MENVAHSIRHLDNPEDRIEKALELIWSYGQIDGDHHKGWVLDQVVRVLTDDYYEDWVQEYEEENDDGEVMYEWDTGIAP